MVCEAPLTQGVNKGRSARGTQAGALRHRRAGEPFCDECRAAQIEYDRLYRLKNLSHLRAIEKRWYYDNLDRARAKNREWSAKNPDRKKELLARWVGANPDRVREIGRLSTRRRRARARQVLTIPYTPEQVAARMSLWGNRCWLRTHCDGAPYEEVDHVIPVSKGGPDCLANLRPACKPCNSAKQDRWGGVASLRSA